MDTLVMWRIISTLLKTNWPRWLVFGMLIIALLVGSFIVPEPPIILLAIAMASVPLLRWRRSIGYMWRFGKKTRGFPETNHGPIVVRYDPKLEGQLILHEVIASCTQSYKDLAIRFGFELKRPLLVYVFERGFDIAAILRDSPTAISVHNASLVCLGADDDTCQETACHEITHVFADQLSRFAPRYLAEGLATCLMGTLRGKPVDSYAFRYIRHGRYLHLSWLADAWIIYLHGPELYAYSGSFVGWLIDHHGWDKVRQFYASHRRRRRWPSFEKAFGLGLLDAEKNWREQLLSRQSEWAQDLAKESPLDAVGAALQAGHLFRCLDECAQLASAGHAGRAIHKCAALAHARLGQSRGHCRNADCPEPAAGT
jgi:hypothetical protein